MSAQINWRQVASRMWAAQSRADLNERPRLLLAWLIYGTVECGRLEIIVPDMNELFAHLGIGKNHHREVRVALMDARMVEFKQVAQGWRVTVFPDPAQWTCGWYHEADAKARWLARLNSLPGQCQGELLPAEPSLTRALAEVGAESAGRVQFPKEEPAVPKMGTPLNPERFSSVKPCTKLLTAELSEAALMARCRELFGEQAMVNWGGRWRNRVRADARKMDRVLAETKVALQEGRCRSPGGYANDLWEKRCG